MRLNLELCSYQENISILSSFSDSVQDLYFRALIELSSCVLPASKNTICKYFHAWLI